MITTMIITMTDDHHDGHSHSHDSHDGHDWQGALKMIPGCAQFPRTQIEADLDANQRADLNDAGRAISQGRC